MCKITIINVLIFTVCLEINAQKLPETNDPVFELIHWLNDGQSKYTDLRLDSIKKTFSYFGEFVGTYTFNYTDCILASSCYRSNYDFFYNEQFDTCTYYLFSEFDSIQIHNKKEFEQSYLKKHRVDTLNRVYNSEISRRTKFGFPRDTVIVYEYDNSNKLIHVNKGTEWGGTTSGGGSRVNTVYKYDSLSRLTSIRTTTNRTDHFSGGETVLSSSCFMETSIYQDSLLSEVVIANCDTTEILSNIYYTYDSLLVVKVTTTYSNNISSATSIKEETFFDSEGNIQEIKIYGTSANRWVLNYHQFNDDDSRPVLANYYHESSGQEELYNTREWCYNSQALELITDNGKITEMYFFSEIDSDCKVVESQQDASSCLFDNDNDGYYASHDCDDSNPNIHPDLDEIIYNGIDDDCDVFTLDDDLDRDGFIMIDDCDDDNADVNPDQTEIAYNGLDDDCNALTLDDDLDEDGYAINEDCDDENAAINPDQLELTYNGLDDDCNPMTLDDDLDEDGYVLEEDCNDENPDINPAAEDIPNNDIDEDCDGVDFISSTTDPVYKKRIIIFPNPAKEYINVSASDSTVDEVNIYNSKGQLMLSSLTANRIDVSSLLPGVYIIETTNDNRPNNQIVKFIIL